MSFWHVKIVNQQNIITRQTYVAAASPEDAVAKVGRLFPQLIEDINVQGCRVDELPRHTDDDTIAYYLNELR